MNLLIVVSCKCPFGRKSSAIEIKHIKLCSPTYKWRRKSDWNHFHSETHKCHCVTCIHLWQVCAGIFNVKTITILTIFFTGFGLGHINPGHWMMLLLVTYKWNCLIADLVHLPKTSKIKAFYECSACVDSLLVLQLPSTAPKTCMWG